MCSLTSALSHTMETSSDNFPIFCPGQEILLNCSTDSSFMGWYNHEGLIFHLNSTNTTKINPNHYGAYYSNFSTLVVRNARQSFDVGCGNSSQNYAHQIFRVLQGV